MIIDEFQALNVSRVNRWHPRGLDEWSLLEWAGAMAGEAGESCNVAKKIKRIENRLPNIQAGIPVSDREKLKDKLRKEVADTIIYGFIILAILDSKPSEVLAEVFNAKSEEYGFPERVIL